MPYIIKVANSDIQIPCKEGDSILQAVTHAGYEIPYSCKTGICGSCKGQLVAGEVDQPREFESLSLDEREKGLTLFCQAKPISNIEILPLSIIKIDKSVPKIIEAKIYRATQVTADVTILELRFSAGKRVQFKAGQYLDVIMDDGSKRSYSMANQPKKNDGVTLHIRHVSGGKFTSYLEDQVKPGMVLKVELPFGNFYLRDESLQVPLIFLASGTGFAPIKSILEDVFRQELSSQPIYLYWGGRTKADLYMSDLPEQWAAQHENFKFIPVLSEENNGLDRTGFVHKAVMDDFPSLKNHHVYACGVPAMVNAAKSDFIEHSEINANQFFADVFLVSGEA